MPVTPTTPGYAAGYSGGAAGPSLPTAATITWPRPVTAFTTRSSVRFGGPTRLTLITGTRSSTIQPSASAIASTAESPQPTSAAYSVACGTTPWNPPAWPTSSEAMEVACGLARCG